MICKYMGLGMIMDETGMIIRKSGMIIAETGMIISISGMIIAETGMISSKFQKTASQMACSPLHSNNITSKIPKFMPIPPNNTAN